MFLATRQYGHVHGPVDTDLSICVREFLERHGHCIASKIANCIARSTLGWPLHCYSSSVRMSVGRRIASSSLGAAASSSRRQLSRSALSFSSRTISSNAMSNGSLTPRCSCSCSSILSRSSRQFSTSPATRYPADAATAEAAKASDKSLPQLTSDDKSRLYKLRNVGISAHIDRCGFRRSYFYSSATS